MLHTPVREALTPHPHRLYRLPNGLGASIASWSGDCDLAVVRFCGPGTRHYRLIAPVGLAAYYRPEVQFVPLTGLTDPKAEQMLDLIAALPAGADLQNAGEAEGHGLFHPEVLPVMAEAYRLRCAEHAH